MTALFPNAKRGLPHATYYVPLAHSAMLVKFVASKALSARPQAGLFASFRWPALFFCLLAVLAFQVYSPALHGPFVFDDLAMPFTKPHAALAGFSEWTGVRPLLGLSFWWTFQAGGLDTFPYHVVNVLLHWGSSVLLFWIVRKLLTLAGTERPRREVLSAFSALLFLLHPLQVESVAYISSRSEVLSVFFLFAAFTVFLYRRARAASWPVALAVLALFACAAGTKEHSIAFPAVLLLTDYYWNPGFRLQGMRANWRIYAPLAALAAAGAAFIWRYVSADPTIGFHMKGLAWYSYFFTECRAFFSYIAMFLFPIRQNIDHDFSISRTLMDRGAAAALAAILLLLAAAIVFRRRYPLASFGLLVFTLFLAPTSSFIPIADVFVERRLYLPFIGLVLIALEPLRRIPWKPATLSAALACVILCDSYLAWHRARLWNSVTLLWEDSAVKSPLKARVQTGLGNAYFHERRCGDAARQYEKAAQLERPDFRLYFNWASAYDCLHRPDLAAGMLTGATAERPTAEGFALLGYVQAEQKRWDDALASLQRAQDINPAFPTIYAYRGLILSALGRPDPAREQFAQCLRIDPQNVIARNGWARLNGAGAQ